MKKWLVMLTVLVLALAAPALAEEENVETNELLGVWKADEIEDLTVVIVPGSYAPADNNAKLPDLYSEARWQEGTTRQVEYTYLLNRWKSTENSFLNSLLGNTMANAVRTIGALSDPDQDRDKANAFEYAHGHIGVDIYYDENGYESIDFTKEASGTFYAFRKEDGSVVLFWLDNYDPHIAGVDLHRLTISAPSAEEAARGVLRPVIDMAEGAEAQAAIDVLRWIVKHQCARMDIEALTQSLRTAYAALAPADAQAFNSHYAEISALLLDGMGLNSKTLSNPNRLRPFSDANLDGALAELNKPIENRRAVDLLNAAVTEVLK